MSSDFQATLSFIRVMINKELDGRNLVSPGYLAEAVPRLGSIFALTANECSRLVKHLETVYGTSQDDGRLLSRKVEEWYPEARQKLDYYYWGRLEKYWTRHSILPVEVIRSVDKVTDEIMGFLGNPSDRINWNRRRGLVMGHVQMGKTTNYSALIAKAADAGYRIIVVLAGSTNSLRYQTQVRLDKTFVGRSSVSDSNHAKIYDVARVFVGEIEGYVLKHPYCGTTQLSDFSTQSGRGVGAHQGNFAVPILFVTKKHAKVLESLTTWLKGLNNGDKLDGPMLLIDDEADNASVNTNKDPKKTTTINGNIRQLLATAKQSTYVAYTATPFANIFIDPDSTDKLEREDLFPADFIKSLEPPSNYVGASRLFAEGGDLHDECVREIPEDYLLLLPIKHKSSDIVASLPESLSDAIREYILCRAMRILAGDPHSHSAMLINVSRFNAVQAQVKSLVDGLLLEIKQGIEAWSMGHWQKSTVMNAMKLVWEKEYRSKSEMDPQWDDVRTVLVEAIRSITSQLVNMKGSGINYESAPATGLHVIGIGGLALARGLTLEGLTVSYVLRNVGAADTLLQMGRWFGYRPGFEKMCRIHAPASLIEDFSSVCDSVEELRGDFERMSRLGKLPIEFGLKVRQSPTGIAITAANKMWAAKSISLAEDFSTRHLQAHTLFNNDESNKKNYSAVQVLHAAMKSEIATNVPPKTEKALVWTHVEVALITAFLDALDLPQTEFNALEDGGHSLVGAYIADRAKGELKYWDVAIPFRTIGDLPREKFPFDVRGGPAFCRQRKHGELESGERLVKISKKNSVAFGDDDMGYGEDESDLKKKVDALLVLEKARSGNKKPPSRTWGYATLRERPLLVVHLLDFGLAEAASGSNFSAAVPVVSVSILFPGTNTECQERKYKASARLIQLLEELRAQEETDEAGEDDE
ncbi:MAG: Z1 domain-containing protein [Pseudomonadota bacterium]